jgi:hypothetical protein
VIIHGFVRSKERNVCKEGGGKRRRGMEGVTLRERTVGSHANMFQPVPGVGCFRSWGFSTACSYIKRATHSLPDQGADLVPK